MGACLSAIVGAAKRQDPDSLFAYTTFKLVKIRDRYLGGLHYLFQLLIFLYVIVYEVFLNAGYLVNEAPTGVARASLLRPRTFEPVSALPYCSGGGGGGSGGDAAVPDEWRERCVYWDRHEVIFPPVRPGTFFITTRSTELRFDRSDAAACAADMAAAANASAATALGPMSPACAFVEQPRGADATAYVADVENFTLLMAHAVYGKATGVTASGVCMDGYLPYPNGGGYIARWPKSSNDVICPDADYSASKYSGDGWTDRGTLPGDVVTVRQLLTAANVASLDEASDVEDSSRSKRYDGIVLVVYIDYANRVSNAAELKYRYIIHRIPRIDIKSEQTIYTRYPDQYVARNRHGILIIFVQIGEIGRFSFKALLLTIVSGLVLLKLAATVVDLIALNFMTYRTAYYRAKYEMTEDFSTVRDVRQDTGADPLAAARLAKQREADDAANEWAAR